MALPNVYHQLETTVYNAPTIGIPPIANLTVPNNPVPDNAIPTSAGYCIRLHITNYAGPNSASLNPVSLMPIIGNDGLGWGGEVITAPDYLSPKVIIEGYIETPCIRIGSYFVSQVIDSNGIRYMWPEILTMMLEGRAKVASNGAWQRVDPLWFRDMYGRVYYAPRILDITGSYVEGFPERVQVSITMKL